MIFFFIYVYEKCAVIKKPILIKCTYGYSNCSSVWHLIRWVPRVSQPYTVGYY